MNRKIVLLAAVSLAALTACNGPKTTALQPKAEFVPAVKIMEATLQQVPQDAVYSTTIQANIINNIVPQAGARIRKINVEVGDFVSKGQILAVMDKSNLEKSELQLKNAKAELSRLKSLYLKGGVSQSDYESAELQMKVAQNSYDNLLENTVLRSPVEGVISSRGYDEGDMYAMAGPLFVVQQISPVKMIVGISEKDYSKVKAGDKVSVTTESFPAKTFEGTVSLVYPVIDPSTHTVSVEVKVPNKDKCLRPGMYANARVFFGINTSVVLPDAAIVKQQGSGVRSAFVYDDAEGTVSLRNLVLGRRLGDSYEVLEGIGIGEKVVVKGASSLKNGVKVEVLQ